MPLQFEHSETGDEDGIMRLPYRPDGSDGHTNRGFIDLRGRPEAAREIAEAEPSPVFQDLLAQLATEGSPFFSIGCELGGSPVDLGSGVEGYAAGGYLQIASSDLHGVAAVDLGRQRTLSRRLHDHLTQTVGDRHWQVEVLVDAVGTDALGGPEQVWSLVIQMNALAETLEEAGKSAEELFAEVGRLLATGD